MFSVIFARLCHGSFVRSPVPYPEQEGFRAKWGLGESLESRPQGAMAAAILPERGGHQELHIVLSLGTWGERGSKPSESQDAFHPEATDRLCLLYHLTGKNAQLPSFIERGYRSCLQSLLFEKRKRNPPQLVLDNRETGCQVRAESAAQLSGLRAPWGPCPRHPADPLCSPSA